MGAAQSRIAHICHEHPAGPGSAAATAAPRNSQELRPLGDALASTDCAGRTRSATSSAASPPVSFFAVLQESRWASGPGMTVPPCRTPAGWCHRAREAPLETLMRGPTTAWPGAMPGRLRAAGLHNVYALRALQGEFLGDEVGDDIAGEAQPGGQVDAYLRVVVGEVLRNMEVAARIGLLRQPERPDEGLVQRDHPLPHQLPPLPGQPPVRHAADDKGGGRADPARLQRGDSRDRRHRAAASASRPRR